VKENVLEDYVVGFVYAQDKDINSQAHAFSYRILSGNLDCFDSETSFSLDEFTGKISTAGKLLWEMHGFYSLKIRVTDQGSPLLFSDASISITVLENSHTPQNLRPLNATISIDEYTPAQTILSAYFAESEESMDATPKITEFIFSIEGGNSDLFSFVGNLLVTTKTLMFAEPPVSYSLKIQALSYNPEKKMNETSLTDAIISIIASNKFSPQMSHREYATSLSVNTLVNTPLLQIFATDADTFANTIKYSLSEAFPYSDYFALNPITGKITLSKILNASALPASVIFFVNASDSFVPPKTDSAKVVITIYDVYGSLDFTQTSYSGLVYQNDMVNSYVGKVLATAPGKTAAVKYLIVGSAPFSIEKTTGIVRVDAKFVDRVNGLYYQSMISISILAYIDGTSISAITDMNITVSDVNLFSPNEPLFGPFSPLQFFENDFPIFITTASSIDNDQSSPNNNFIYSIFSGNYNNLFRINHESGEIFTTSSSCLNVSQMTYTLVIVATDKAIKSENITCLNRCQNYANDYIFDSTAIQTTCTSSCLGKELTFETCNDTCSNRTFASACNAGCLYANFPKEAASILVINFQKVTDSNPTFDLEKYTASIAMSAELNVFVLSVSATSNAVCFENILYHIVNETNQLVNANKFFAIDLKLGLISLIANISSLADSDISFIIAAIDSHTKGTTYALVTISVLSMKYFATFNVSGNGFLLEPQETVASGQVIKVGLPLKLLPGSSGSISASLGNFKTASQIFTTNLLSIDPALTTAVLATRDVYYDKRKISALVQLTAENFGNQINKSDYENLYKLQIIPSDILKEKVNAVNVEGSTCDFFKGVCHASVDVPEKWFQDTIGGNEVIDVKLLIGASTSLSFISRVLVHYKPSLGMLNASNGIINDVVAILPSGSLVQGENFNVDVYGNGDYFVTAFTLTFTVGIDLSITGITCDNNEWSCIVVRVSNLTYSVTATTKESKQPQANKQPNQKLFQLKASVNLDAKIGFASIFASIDSFVNRNGLILFDGKISKKAQMYDRFGYSQLGRIELLAAKFPLAITSYSDLSELVNLAVLGSSLISSDVYIMQLSADLTLQRGIATCTSADENVVKVTENCSNIYLDGSEKLGSSITKISVRSSLGGFVTSFSVRVYFPKFPVLVTNFDATLNAIPGIFMPNGCQQLFQKTAPRIAVQFGYPFAPSLTQMISILPLIEASIVNSHPLVASLSQGIIEGHTVGTTILSLVVHRRTILMLTITVSDVPVIINYMQGLVYTDFSLSLSKTAMASKFDSFLTATAKFDQNFYVPFLTGSLVVFAFFTDGNTYPFQVSEHMGLRAYSLDNSKVIVNGITVTVLEEVAGNNIVYTWDSIYPNCSESSSIAHGVAFVKSNFLKAEDLLVSPMSARLRNNDISLTVALSNAGDQPKITQNFMIQLVFEGNHAVIASGRNGFVLNLQNANNLFYVTKNSVDGVEITAGSVAGTGSFNVSYYNFTKTILVTVVKVVDFIVSASPFPIYPNSFLTTVVELGAYNNSLPVTFQSAALSAVLKYSDFIVVDVSSFIVFSYTDITTNNLVESNIVRSSEAGDIAITASLNNYLTWNNLSIKFNASKLISVIVLDLQFNQSTNTLSGLRNSLCDDLVVNAVFNDNTIYMNLFPKLDGGFRLADIPNIIKFSSDNEKIISVDLNSTLTLLHNHFKVVTIAAIYDDRIVDNVDIFANLLPSIGDVDIGADVGAALPNVNIDDIFSVPVFVNTGTMNLGSIALYLNYDNTQVELVSFSSNNTDLNKYGGTLFATDYDGFITFGGCPAIPFSSNKYFIASFQFQALKNGPLNLSGAVNGMFSSFADGIANPIPNNPAVSVPRDWIAGDHRDHSKINRRQVIRRSNVAQDGYTDVACNNAPCVNCPKLRQSGDANFDCVLNILDASYHQTYLAEKATNFITANGKLMKKNYLNTQNLDIDKNMDVNLQDTIMLLQVIFKQMVLLTNFTFQPVQVGTNCSIKFTCNLVESGDIPAFSSNLFVAFEITGTDIQNLAQYNRLQNLFDDSKVIGPAAKLNVTRSAGHSLVVQASSTIKSGEFEAMIYTPIAMVNFGVSLILRISDISNTTHWSRSLTGSPLPEFSYSARKLEFNNFEIVSPDDGYNPFMLITSKFASQLCFNFFAPAVADSLTFTIPDFTLSNTLIGTIIASDEDSNKISEFLPGYVVDTLSSQLKWYITKSDAPIGIFKINALTGALSLISSPIPLGTYNLTVEVRDLGFLQVKKSTSLVTVKIVSGVVTFTEASSNSATIFEDEKENYLVKQVLASSSSMASVKYRIIAVFPFVSLKINSIGKVYLSSDAKMNFAVSAFHIVSIEAYDDSTFQTISAIVNFTIDIAPHNKNPPKFLQSKYYADIYESSTPETIFFGFPSGFVIQVLATDVDICPECHNITYSIIEGDKGVIESCPGRNYACGGQIYPNLFAINSKNGIITLEAKPDFEQFSSYDLVVRAEDAGTSLNSSLNLSSTVIIRVNILMSDHQPMFTLSNYLVTIGELIVKDSIILTILATNQDGINPLKYTIINGDPKSLFSCNQTSGEISIKQDRGLNFSAQSYFNLTVQAQDDSDFLPKPLQDYSYVGISVVAQNLYTPQFNASSYSFKVKEDKIAGYIIGAVFAFDDDISLASKSIRFFVGSVLSQLILNDIVQTSNTKFNPFKINAVSGVISVEGSLDWSSFNSYTLTVVAADQGVPVRSSFVSVQISVIMLDQNCSFISVRYLASVGEQAAQNTLVTTIQANTEKNIYANNAPLSYEIISGNSDAMFSLNSVSGEVKVKNPPFTPGTVFSFLNSSKVSHYSLTVQAVDQSNYLSPNFPKCSTSIEIDIIAQNLYYPYFQNVRPLGHSLYIAASKIFGAQPQNFIFSSPLPFGVSNNVEEIGWSLSDNEYFVVDFERKQLVNLFRAYSTIRESARTVTWQLKFSDDNITYQSAVNFSFVTKQGFGKNDDGSYRNDFAGWYEVTIPGNSAARFWRVALTIPLSLSPPKVAQVEFYAIYDYKAIVQENASIGQYLTVVSADIQNVNIASRTLRYSIVAGNKAIQALDGTGYLGDAQNILWPNFKTSYYPTSFAIDSITGVVTIAAQLQFEIYREYDLTIRVENLFAPTKFIESILHIDILMNNHIPIFTQPNYTVAIGDESLPDSIVLMVEAFNEDRVPLNYSIISGNDDNIFAIGRESGIIRVIGAYGSLKYDVKVTHQLIIQASDATFFIDGSVFVAKGPKPAITTVQVVININPQNMFAPYFTTEFFVWPTGNYGTIGGVSGGTPTSPLNYYMTSVQENFKTGDFVIRVFASDFDLSTKAHKLSFAIVGGNLGVPPYQNSFAIDSTTGNITVNGNIDYFVIPQYLLTVQVSDEGTIDGKYAPLSTIATVKIVISQDNHQPIFQKAIYNITIGDGALVDTVILSVKAVNTYGAGIQYFLSGSDSAAFKVNSYSGNLSTKINFISSDKALYVFTILAKDFGPFENPVVAGPLIDTTTVNVHLFADNLYGPEFRAYNGPSQSYSAAIPENSKSGDIVYTVTALDKDVSVLPKTVSFTILQCYAESIPDINYNENLFAEQVSIFGINSTKTLVNCASLFQVDLASGTVSVASNSFLGFHWGIYNRYYLILQAKDNSQFRPQLSTEAMLVVSIIMSSHKPVFTIPSNALVYSSSIDEQASQGTSIIQIYATNEANNLPQQLDIPLIYSIISGNVGNVFIIDSATGMISVSGTGTDEFGNPRWYGLFNTSEIVSYSLTIRATDKQVYLSNPEITDVIVQIAIVPTCYNPPVFTKIPYFTSIQENAKIEQDVIQVFADTFNNNIASRTIIFTIDSASNPEAAFFIDQNTGKITVAKTLEWEEHDNYQLKVTASTLFQPPQSSSVFVNITIKLNSHLPKFNQSFYSGNCGDGYIQNQTIGVTVQATTAEGLRAGGLEYPLEYTISAGNTGDAFSIGKTNGEIRVLGEHGTLSHTLKPFYELIVTASDITAFLPDKPINSSVKVIIAIFAQNNYPPYFTTSANNWNEGSGPKIGIVKGGIPTTPLNTYNVTIQENATIGQVLTQVFASDMDTSTEPHTFTFAILENANNNAGVPPYSHSFAMNYLTGFITVIGNLDFFSIPSYSLQISVTDRGTADNLNDEKTTFGVVNINILQDGHKPVFSLNSYEASIGDEQPSNTEIVQLFASNQYGSVLTYSIFDGNELNSFKIDAKGILSVNNNKPFNDGSLPDSQLKASTKNSYILTVRAFDNTMNIFTDILVTINIIEENTQRPIFTNLNSLSAYSTTIHESKMIDSLVYRITTEDKDISTPSTTVTYTIKSVVAAYVDVFNQKQIEDPASTIVAKFSIDSITGEIKTKELLEYELRNLYYLTVEASDNPSQSSKSLKNTVIITIYVSMNSHEPIFSQPVYSVSVSELATSNQLVVTVHAVSEEIDFDIQHNITSTPLNYNIISGNINSVFIINSVTGAILVSPCDRNIPASCQLNSDVLQTYTLFVVAIDNSPYLFQPMSSYAAVNITVTPENGFTPKFKKLSYDFNLVDSTAVGSIVQKISATDEDVSSPSNLVTFSLLDPTKTFNVTFDGNIVLQKPVDFTKLNLYIFVVTALDGKQPIKSVKINISVSITPVYFTPLFVAIDDSCGGSASLCDAYPQCLDFSKCISNCSCVTKYDGFVYENDYNNTIVGHVKALQPRYLDRINISYEIVSSIFLPFSVDSQGFVRKIASLDASIQSKYIFTIKAKFIEDNFTSFATMEVIVEDANTKMPTPPIFENDKTIAQLAMSEFIGRYVATVLSTDNDVKVIRSSKNNQIRFSISKSSVFPPLSIEINETSGVVTTNKKSCIINESVTETITIMACDIPIGSVENCISRCVNWFNSVKPVSYNLSMCETGCEYAKILQNTKLLQDANGVISIDDCTIQCNGDLACMNGCFFYDGYALCGVNALSVKIISNSIANPIFGEPIYYAHTFVTAQPETFIKNVQATDEDGCSGPLFYHLGDTFNTRTQDNGIFRINERTGDIFVSGSSNRYEPLQEFANKTYSLNLIVSDGGSVSENATFAKLFIVVQAPILLKTLNAGALSGNIPVRINNTNYIQTIVLDVATPPGKNSGVKYILGDSLSEIAQFSTQKTVYSGSINTLLDQVIWVDSPVIHVLVEIRDNTNGIHFAALPEYVYLSLEASEFTSVIGLNCSCQSNFNVLNKACLASIEVPASWFASITSDTIAEVFVHVPGIPLASVGTVSIQFSKLYAITEGLQIILPKGRIFPGEKFDAEIWGRVENAEFMTAFSLTMNIASTLTIIRVDCDKDWSCVGVAIDNQTYSISAVYKKASIEADNRFFGTASNQFLARIYITANSDIRPGQNGDVALITAQINLLLSNLDTILVNNELQKEVLFVDRFGESNIGKIVIAVPNRIIAITAWAESTELLNTAVLSGIKVASRLIILKLSADMKFVYGNTTSICKSLDITILQVDQNCATIYLDGSETQGSGSAFIEISADGITVILSIIVYFPMLPIVVKAVDSKLNLVDNDAFLQQSYYQSTNFRAYANFILPVLPLRSIMTEVSEFVNTWKSLNASAIIVNGSAIGKFEGTATIVAEGAFNTYLGQVDIEISNKAVHVHHLFGFAFTRLSALVSARSTPHEYFSKITANFQISQQLHYINDTAKIVVFAFYDDGSHVPQLLLNDLDLSYMSYDKSVLAVDQGIITAVGGGIGRIFYEWKFNGTTVATGLTYIVVDLIKFTILPSLHEITVCTTLAGIIDTNLLKSDSFTVDALFLDSSTLDITSLVQFSVTTGSDKIQVTLIAGKIVVTSLTENNGTAFITLAYQEKISLIKVWIVGVNSFKMTAYPFPIYDHDNFSIKVLKKIAKTDPVTFQSAILSLTVNLTNDKLYDVTYDILTSFALSSSENIFSLDRNIISVKSEFSQGTSQVTATYRNVSVNVDLITVESTVNITALRCSLLRDTKSMNTLFLNLEADLFDNTKLPIMFDLNGSSLYPSAVKIDSFSNTSVNVAKQLVSIIDNKFKILYNFPKEIFILATSAESSSVFCSPIIFANLDARFGDVDLGFETGISIKRIEKIGDIIEVPVFANTGEVGLSAIDLIINYNISVFDFISCNNQMGELYTDFFLQGGFISYVVKPGYVKFGGIVTKFFTSNRYSITTCTFKAKMVAEADFYGQINKMSKFYYDNDDMSIGKFTEPRFFLAGDLRFNAYKFNLTVNDLVVPETGAGYALTPCNTVPCSQCVGKRHTGDVNGDCVFDILDVSFHEKYLAEMYAGFHSVQGIAINNFVNETQIQLIDVDHNGVINFQDTILLQLTMFEQFSLLESISVQNVSKGSNCTVVISSRFVLVRNIPSSKLNTAIVFLISGTPKQNSTEVGMLQQLFNGIKVVEGEGKIILPNSDLSSPILGQLIQAVDKGNGSFDTTFYLPWSTTSVGVSVFESYRDFSGERSYGFFGNPDKDSEVPSLQLGYEVKLDGSDTKVIFVRALKTNGFSPFLTFRNTHASHMCFNEFSPIFTVSNGTTYTVPDRSNPGYAITDGLVIPHPTARDRDQNDINPKMDVKNNFITSNFSSLLVYSIVDGNIGNKFTIDALTGKLSLASFLHFDVDGIDKYSLVIKASDSGIDIQLESTIMVYIVVQDKIEQQNLFSQRSYETNIPERQDPGMYVLRLSASSHPFNNLSIIDNSTTLIYSIENGPNQNYFTINNAGILITAVKFDRNYNSTLVITVKVMDAGKITIADFANVTVNIFDINDMPPSFTNNNTLECDESTPANIFIMQLAIADLHRGHFNNHKFSLVNIIGVRKGYFPPYEAGDLLDVTDLFSVNNTTGSLYTAESAEKLSDFRLLNVTIAANNLYPKFSLQNYEPYLGKIEYFVGAPIYDLYSEQNIIITITPGNYFIPEFIPNNNYIFNLPELTSFSVVVGKVQVVDKDAYTAGMFRFAIVGTANISNWAPSTNWMQVNISSVDTQNGDIFPFEINSTSGSISVIKNNLRYQDQNVYQFIVQVSDFGFPISKVNYARVTVNLIDDLAPLKFDKINQFKILFAMTPLGTVCGVVQAADFYSETYWGINYSIASGDSFDLFHIDEHTGLLTVKASLMNKTGVYVLVINAFKEYNPIAMSKAYFEITILASGSNDTLPLEIMLQSSDVLKSAYATQVQTIENLQDQRYPLFTNYIQPLAWINDQSPSHVESINTKLGSYNASVDYLRERVTVARFDAYCLVSEVWFANSAVSVAFQFTDVYGNAIVSSTTGFVVIKKQ